MGDRCHGGLGAARPVGGCHRRENSRESPGGKKQLCARIYLSVNVQLRARFTCVNTVGCMCVRLTPGNPHRPPRVWSRPGFVPAGAAFPLRCPQPLRIPQSTELSPHSEDGRLALFQSTACFRTLIEVKQAVCCVSPRPSISHPCPPLTPSPPSPLPLSSFLRPPAYIQVIK